eukprot:1510874-Prymnesium_polylepis.1
MGLGAREACACRPSAGEGGGARVVSEGPRTVRRVAMWRCAAPEEQHRERLARDDQRRVRGRPQHRGD